jgi:hypothetical protein
MDSTEPWLVRGFHKKNGSYVLEKGWRWFCLENSLEGDICTFNVIEPTVACYYQALQGTDESVLPCESSTHALVPFLL